MYAKPLPRHPPPTPSAMPSAAPKASFKIGKNSEDRSKIKKMEPGLERSYSAGSPAKNAVSKVNTS